MPTVIPNPSGTMALSIRQGPSRFRQLFSFFFTHKHKQRSNFPHIENCYCAKGKNNFFPNFEGKWLVIDYSKMFYWYTYT